MVKEVKAGVCALASDLVLDPTTTRSRTIEKKSQEIETVHTRREKTNERNSNLVIECIFMRKI